MSRALEDLKNDLSQLLEYLDLRFYINDGGCCYVAYILARELEAMGIKYQLIIYNDEGINSKTKKLPIRSAIKSRNSFDKVIGIGKATCAHYAIFTSEFGIINSAGCDNDPKLKSISLGAINSLDIEWLYRTGSWNRCYNKKFSEIIKDYIHLAFKGYEIRKEDRQED